jgi:hypothetical protein
MKIRSMGSEGWVQTVENNGGSASPWAGRRRGKERRRGVREGRQPEAVQGDDEVRARRVGRRFKVAQPVWGREDRRWPKTTTTALCFYSVGKKKGRWFCDFSKFQGLN